MNETLCTTLVKQRAVAHDPSLDEHMQYLPCEFCGAFVEDFERHHRQFRSRGGAWTPDNVILLCRTCHGRTTREELPGTGLNVPTWESPFLVPVSVWYCESMVLLGILGGYTPVG